MKIDIYSSRSLSRDAQHTAGVLSINQNLNMDKGNLIDGIVILQLSFRNEPNSGTPSCTATSQEKNEMPRRCMTRQGSRSAPLSLLSAYHDDYDGEGYTPTFLARPSPPLMIAGTNPIYTYLVIFG